MCHSRTVKHHDPNEKHRREQAARQARHFAQRDAQCRRKKTRSGKIGQEHARGNPGGNQRGDTSGIPDVHNAKSGERDREKDAASSVSYTHLSAAWTLFLLVVAVCATVQTFRHRHETGGLVGYRGVPRRVVTLFGGEVEQQGKPSICLLYTSRCV